MSQNNFSTAVICFICLFSRNLIHCHKPESTFSKSGNSSAHPPRYLLYDVNPSEGFNLRRDVYIRMTSLILELQKRDNWVLVLPPWAPLHHWRSPAIDERLPWGHFFDVPSLQKFAPVMEYLDFSQKHRNAVIDNVYVLQHFEKLFRAGVFENDIEVQECSMPHTYKRTKDGRLYQGHYLGFKDLNVQRVDCLSFHGPASFLAQWILQLKNVTILLEHAEVILHDRYGDNVYWSARRSMRFARSLVNIADEFRAEYLNSSDIEDNTIIPDDWTQQKHHRKAIGGPYISVHLRRTDFLYARSAEIPSLPNAVNQLKQELVKLQLNTLFVATDAPLYEIEELEDLTASHGINMVIFRPSDEQHRTIKEGGVAIIDQIVASHARKFIGTFESTFSYRIQEEREILGFKPETTFNRLCGDAVETCEQPTQWLIRY